MLIGNWSVPISIAVFFCKKIGRFLLQSEHDNSQFSLDEGDMLQKEILLKNLNN
jgi:hypothetical protein